MAGGAGWTVVCWSPDDDMNRIRVVLTGGPGGGKSTLIEDLASDPFFAGRFVALPEAIALDGWLAEAWAGHPDYRRVDNAGRDWAAKSVAARRILAQFV
jgi:hypothetical protein